MNSGRPASFLPPCAFKALVLARDEVHDRTLRHPELWPDFSATLPGSVIGAVLSGALADVDPSRIRITGGAYGGYMTLMARAKTPDRWAAGVDEYDIVNWFSMSGAPDLRLYQTGLLGDPAKDKAIYEAASPLTYFQNTKAPLLVLQGENDPRVPRGEIGDRPVVDVHYYPDMDLPNVRIKSTHSSALWCGSIVIRSSLRERYCRNRARIFLRD